MLVSLYYHCENEVILYHDLYLHPFQIVESRSRDLCSSRESMIISNFSLTAEQAFLFEGSYRGLVFMKFDVVYFFILLSDRL